MPTYHYDILEPDSDLTIAVDNLQHELGALYKESWDTDKRAAYGDKPFALNIEAFARMWFTKSLKIFMAYDERNDPIGFLVGIVFRPLPYEATVFQVEDWFTRGNKEVERGLFQHVTNAIRYIGCDEIWASDKANRDADFGTNWKNANSFTLNRYIRA